jgi:DNA replication regulator DPB11
VANEGTYLKNLERPVKVTHLLCSGDEETDKMRYAEKFNSRGEAKIHLVWEEWFWDSLEFQVGGRFDEVKYTRTSPREENHRRSKRRYFRLYSRLLVRVRLPVIGMLYKSS